MTLFRRKPQWPDFPEREVNGVITTNQYETDRWQVEMRRQLALLVPPTHYGCCYCCNLPWWVVEGHTIPFGDGQGCFPVCKSCFHDLNADEVWPYYRDWVRQYYPQYEDELKRNLYNRKPFQSLPPTETSIVN